MNIPAKANTPVNLLHVAWLVRADLRQGQSAGNTVPDWFAQWWLVDGWREYPLWPRPDAAQRQTLLQLLPDWPSYGPFGMTQAFWYLLQRREDLVQTFDVSTESGLWHGIAWFFTHGLKEHGLMDLVDAETLAALDQTPPFAELQAAVANQQTPLTWLMFFVWRSAAELQQNFDIRTADGQARYLHWFLFDAVHRLKLTPLLAPRWRSWLAQRLELRTQPGVTVSRATLMLWQRRRDLQQVYDLKAAPGWGALARWEHKARQTDAALHWLADPLAAPAQDAAAKPAAPRPFGLNLIGFAFGEMGIGEDVRMAAAACEAAGIPFKVVNIHPGDHLRQADRALEEHLGEEGDEEAPYAVNLFCLTGFDTVRVYLERGLALFAGRYNIGWWPWELPVWPTQWQSAFEVVDEVWAATAFTHAMYTSAQQAASAPLPVTLMPLAASVARVQPTTRQELGLPEQRFLFLYVFDFNSYLARKNPFAAIQAFQKAFSPDDDSVGLVLKTMNSQPDNPEWQRFVKACGADARIVLLDQTLDRGAVLGLIDACDAYVSLHRAEGFGRSLAEAMLFGKPVVGTHFSGNVDFLTEETGFPVKWKRCAVKPGEYPFVVAQDQAWWAAPDIAHAASQMQAARSAGGHTAFAKRLKKSAEVTFSPQRIGLLMRERLGVIQRDRFESEETVLKVPK